MPKKDVDLGELLRNYRKTRHISLARLAEATGVTTSFLSQFERGLTGAKTPTIQSIARALNISPEDFSFIPGTSEWQVLSATTGAVKNNVGFRTKLLSDQFLVGMNVFLIEMNPGYTVRRYPCPTPQAQDFLFVVDGELALSCAGNMHLLEEGDSSTFPISSNVDVSSVGPIPAKALWAIANKDVWLQV